MNPDLVDLGRAILCVIATSRESLNLSAVALLSVVDDLWALLQGGTIHSVSVARDALLDGMKARAENRRADSNVKNATAFKTLVEAIRIANADTRDPKQTGTSGTGEALDNFKRALAVLSLLDGRLMVDEASLAQLRRLLQLQVQTTESSVPMPGAGRAGQTIDVAASGVGGSAASAVATSGTNERSKSAEPV